MIGPLLMVAAGVLALCRVLWAWDRPEEPAWRFAAAQVIGLVLVLGGAAWAAWRLLWAYWGP